MDRNDESKTREQDWTDTEAARLEVEVGRLIDRVPLERFTMGCGCITIGQGVGAMIDVPCEHHLGGHLRSIARTLSRLPPIQK